MEEGSASARLLTAELREGAQSEREARAKQAARNDKLEAQLARAVERAERAEAELRGAREKAEGAEEAMRGGEEERKALETSRRGAVIQASKLKEEVAALRIRLVESEANVRRAEEGRLEYVSQIVEMEASVEKMRREMIQVSFHGSVCARLEGEASSHFPAAEFVEISPPLPSLPHFLSYLCDPFPPHLPMTSESKSRGSLH